MTQRLLLASPLGVPIMAMQTTDLWQQYIDSGNAACRERRYDEAEQFYARALSEAEQAGISEDCLALSINNLAWVSHRLGKYRQAEPLYLRALSLVRRLCGLEHPDVATVLQNMARMYSASERGDIAEQMLRQALDIRRKAFGPDNDQVLATHEEFRRLLRENEARIKAAQRENADPQGRSSLKSLAEDIAHPQPAFQIPESLAVTSDPVSQMSRLDPSEAVTQLASQIEAISMLEDSQACTIDPERADLNDPQRQTKQMEPAPETVARIEDSQACTVDPIRAGNFIQPLQQQPALPPASDNIPPPGAQFAQGAPQPVARPLMQPAAPPIVQQVAPPVSQPTPPPVFPQVAPPVVQPVSQPVSEVAQVNPTVPKVERPGPIKVNAPQPSHTNQAANQLKKANTSGFKIPRPGVSPRVVPPVPNFTSDQASTLTELKAAEITAGLESQAAPEPIIDAMETLNPLEPANLETSLETTVDYAYSPIGTEPAVEQPALEQPEPTTVNKQEDVANDLPSTSLVKPARPNAAIRPEPQPEQAIQGRVNPTPGDGKNPLQVKLPRPDAAAGPIPEIPPFVVTDNAETLMEVKVSQVMAGIPKEVLDRYGEDDQATAQAPAVAEATVVAEAPVAEAIAETPVAEAPTAEDPTAEDPTAETSSAETAAPENAGGDAGEVILPGAEAPEEKRQGKRKRKALKAKLPRPGVVPSAMPNVPSFINSDQIATLADIPTGGLFDDDGEDEEPSAPVQPVIGGSSFFDDLPAPIAIKRVESAPPPLAPQAPEQVFPHLGEPAVAQAQPESQAPAQPTPGVMLPPKTNSGQFPQLELPPPARVNQSPPLVPIMPPASQPMVPQVPAAAGLESVPAVAQSAPQGDGTAGSPHPSNVSQTSVPPLPGFVRESQPVMPFRSDIDLGSSSVPPPLAPNAVPPVPEVPPHHVPPVPALGTPDPAPAPVMPPLVRPEVQVAPAASMAPQVPTTLEAEASPSLMPTPPAMPDPAACEQARPAFIPQTQPPFAVGESISFAGDPTKDRNDQKAYPEFFSGGPTDAAGAPPVGFASLTTNIDESSDETINLDRLGRAPDQLNTMNNIPKIRLVPPAAKPQPVFGQPGPGGGPPPVEVAEPVSKQRIPRSFEHIEDDDEEDDPWTAAPPAAEKPATSSLRKAVSRQSVSPKSLEDLVDPGEKAFEVLTTCVGAGIYGLSLLFLIGFIYLPIMIAAFILRSTVLRGKVVSNGIRVSERQFPEIFTVVCELSSMMALPVPPAVYIVNRDQFGNAFSATRHRRDYMVLYADVLDSLPEAEVSFLLAREMAHLKRGHTAGSLVRLPAMYVPLIGAGYARGCELTADNFGRYFKPEGARMGLVYLMCSAKLVKKVNMEALYKQAEDEQDSQMFDALSPQPSLSKRIKEMSKVVKIG